MRLCFCLFSFFFSLFFFVVVDDWSGEGGGGGGLVGGLCCRLVGLEQKLHTICGLFPLRIVNSS